MNENKTIYAGATLGGDSVTFHLTYVSNGGAEFEYKVRGFTKTTEVDFEDPEYIPTRKGYVFTGWYADEATQTEPLKTLEVSGDMTVYAGWKEKTVILTLVYDQTWQSEGDGTPDVTVEMKPGTVVDMSEVDGSVDWYEDENLKTLITEAFTMNEDKTIYAGTSLSENKEETVTLTLVYDKKWQTDGTGTPDVTIEMDMGTVVNMSEVDSSVEWYEDADFETLITDTFTMDTDKTIYAKQDSDTNTAFHLVYISNGGAEFGFKVRTFTKATDVDFEDSDYIPTKEKYAFTGWYADSALTTRMDGIVKVSGDMTVYAGWKQVTATLTMVRDQNWKDTHTGIPDVSTDMPVGSIVDMTTDTVDWYEDPKLETPITEAFILTEDKTIYSGVVLTLVYDPLYQSIGVGEPDVIIVMPFGTKVDMTTLTIPGHEGDDPVPWTTESGVIETVITKPFVMYENKTIYAGTTIRGGADDLYTGGGTTFHLSYHSNGGSYIRARAFTEPTKVDFEDPNYIPTREGYEFTGWYTDFDLATRMTGTVLISGETTVVAGWKAKDTTEEETKGDTPTEPTKEIPGTELPTEPAKETPGADTPTEATKETVAGSNETGTRQTNTQQNTIQETSTPDTIDGNVSTGDQSNVTLWFTVLMLSCMGIVAVTIYKKKRR
jgi:uncharacterized repeat protein (TIGR02543 family)